MPFHWIILNLVTILTASVLLNLNNDTTETERSASYLDLHVEDDSKGGLKQKKYDKWDDFDFPIVKYPFISSNIPATPANGVYKEFEDTKGADRSWNTDKTMANTINKTSI